MVLLSTEERILNFDPEENDRGGNKEITLQI